jgi:hypothetical protein
VVFETSDPLWWTAHQGAVEVARGLAVDAHLGRIGSRLIGEAVVRLPGRLTRHESRLCEVGG